MGDEVYLWHDVEQTSKELCRPEVFRTDSSINSICCGETIAAFKVADSRVFVMNWAAGRLLDSKAPRILDSLRSLRVKQITCGHSHFVALDDTGKVHSLGANDSGQLGAGHTDMVPGATASSNAGLGGLCTISGLPVISSVSCGLFHTAALSTNGEVFVWGDNRYGQLGLPSGDFSPRPVKLRLPHSVPITAVACGARHTLLLDAHGDVYSFGANDLNQLGRNTNGQNDWTVVKVSALEGGVSKIAANEASAVLDHHGRLFVWGGHRDVSCATPLLRPSRQTPGVISLTLTKHLVVTLSEDGQISLRPIVFEASFNGDDETTLQCSKAIRQIAVGDTRIMALGSQQSHSLQPQPQQAFNNTMPTQYSGSQHTLNQNSNSQQHNGKTSVEIKVSNPQGHHQRPVSSHSLQQTRPVSQHHHQSFNDTGMGATTTNIRVSSPSHSPVRTRINISQHQQHQNQNQNVPMSPNSYEQDREAARNMALRLEQGELQRVRLERELSALKSELEAQRRQHEMDLSASETQQRRLQTQVATLTKERDDVQREAIRLEQEREEDNRQFEWKRKALQQKFEDDHFHVDDELKKALAERDGARRELVELEAEKRSRLRELTQLREDARLWEEKSRQKSAEAERLRAENVRLETTAEECQSDAKKLARMVEDLKKTNSDLERNVFDREQQLKATNQELQGELEIALSDWSRLREQMEKENRAEVDKLQRQLRQERTLREDAETLAKTQKDAFDRLNFDVQLRREESEAALALAKRKLQECEDELREARSSLKSRQDATEKLRQQLEKQKLETQEAENATGEAFRTVQDITEQLRDIQQRYNDLQNVAGSQLADSVAALDEARSENAALRSRIEARDDQLSQKDEKLAELGQLLANLAEAYKTNESALAEALRRADVNSKQVAHLESRIQHLASEPKYDLSGLVSDKVQRAEVALQRKEEQLQQLQDLYEREKAYLENLLRAQQEEQSLNKNTINQLNDVLNRQAEDLDNLRAELEDMHIVLARYGPNPSGTTSSAVYFKQTHAASNNNNMNNSMTNSLGRKEQSPVHGGDASLHTSNNASSVSIRVQPHAQQ